jgi:hypothetical protein
MSLVDISDHPENIFLEVYLPEKSCLTKAIGSVIP